MDTQPTVTPENDYDTLSDALHKAKLRVVQLSGWVAFAKVRDGIATVKPRKARAARKALIVDSGDDAVYARGNGSEA